MQISTLTLSCYQSPPSSESLANQALLSTLPLRLIIIATLHCLLNTLLKLGFTPTPFHLVYLNPRNRRQSHNMVIE